MMEFETDEFNWHLKWFLLYANSFQAHQNKPNRSTTDLLIKALDIISNLTENCTFDDELDEAESIDSFFDGEMFDSYQILFCRACKKSFTFNRHDYNSHINSGQHKKKLLKSKCENVLVKVGEQKTIDGQAESVQRCHDVEEPLSPLSSYEMVEANSKYTTISEANKVDNLLATGERKLSSSTQSLSDQRICEILGQSGSDTEAQSMQLDSFNRNSTPNVTSAIILNDNIEIASKLSIPKVELNYVSTFEETVQIFIRNLTGKTEIYEVKTSDSVESLREKIKGKNGMPPCRQRLIYGGKQLEDSYTLSFYNIRGEATVHLLLRMGGGYCNVCSKKRDD